MPRRNVAFRSGNYYHLYNRGNNHQLIFFERENYLYFLRLLRHHLANDTLDIIAYCLMPNHYHLLVHLKINNLSSSMQSFGLAYTKAMNQRYERSGSLFQGRFQAIHVDNDVYLSNLSRYIHLNPVKAGLVGKAEEWEFSSYPEYVGLRGGTLPKREVIASQFASAEAYRRFAEAKGDLQIIRHLMVDE
jgi:putative transposase